jgi:hypothetical protein
MCDCELTGRVQVPNFHLELLCEEEEVTTQQVKLYPEGISYVPLYLASVLLKNELVLPCRLLYQSH